MGRAALLTLTARAALACALLSPAAPAALAGSRAPEPPDGPARFGTRIVAALGSPHDRAVRVHLAHAASLGFDAVWIAAGEVGHFSADVAPDGPFLDPGFPRFVAWCRARGLRVFAVVSPVGMTGGRHRFTDPDARRRVVRFVRLLRDAGVHDVVLAFDDQPTVLSELNDVLRFGRSSARAHLDLARRLARVVRRGGSLWLIPSAYCDAHLGDGSGPYAAAFLSGLPDLPAGVGVVWTGPEVVSPSITAADLAATRARLGGRRLLLFDNYPNNGDFHGLGTGLVLGPLRARDRDLPRVADAYLSVPTWELGAARLPLATVADWLADPAAYDPDASWRSAIERLAGPDDDAREALRIQALEWGGWVGGLNYHPAWDDNVVSAAARLDEPAFAASWGWTRERYPERIRDLAGLADEVFRDDLVRVMKRRLAIARAVPGVIEFRARAAAGRPDAAVALVALRALRADPDLGDDAARALDRFLSAAGVPPVGTSADPVSPAPVPDAARGGAVPE